MHDRPQLDTIFGRAITIEKSDEREAFVNDACRGDADLRKAVKQLVRDHFRAGDFLEQPAACVDMDNLGGRVDELIGERIGPYVIRELLGEGGMGSRLCCQTERAGTSKRSPQDHSTRHG